MASDPITSWQIDGEAMETVRDFIFLGSKIIVDGDCLVQSVSHVRLFATPWTATHQASLSITNSWSLLKLIHVHRVGDGIQLPYSLSSPSPPPLGWS